MTVETRIDRIERRLGGGEIDVVYVITREGYLPRIARINGEEFPREEGEFLSAFTDRALQEYRSRYRPVDKVSVLIMDCRH